MQLFTYEIMSEIIGLTHAKDCESQIIFYCIIFVNSVISLSDRHVCLRLSGHRYFAHATNFLLELLHISALQCPECTPFKTY